MRKPRLTRRRFLLGLGVGALGAYGYAWGIEPHWVTVAHRDMPVRSLPPQWEGRTIVQVSDLHIGPQVDSDYIAASLRRVSELNPDLVVVTGDFMSWTNPQGAEEVARVFEHLAPPRFGCLAILGNHDYGRHWSDTAVADGLVHRVTDVGVTVLRNASRVVDGLRVAGIEDLWCPNFRLDAVPPLLAGDEPTIALCHNPDGADLSMWGSYRGWILSGHTHGGQCKPPFLPPPMLPVLNRRYTRGEFDLGDGRSLYINPGLGHLLRARFNVRPEITLFRLVNA